MVVPLGEITDEESVRESPAHAVEEPHAGQDDEPFAAYAEGEGSEEPADAEPVAPADEPTEQFDPMQHEAGDYDAAPAEPLAAYAEGQASEEPAAEAPTAEPAAAGYAADEPAEDEPHWPFSEPEETGEQPAVQHDAPQPGAVPPPPGASGYPWGQAQGHGHAPPAPTSPFAPPGAGAAPVPQAPPFDDHDGNTVAGGWDPSRFARQQPGIPGQPPAPSVTAQPVARLVFSSGETVDVDRAVLIGRAPEARRFTSTDQPRLVTVPSPHQEISSTHVEVRPGSGADHGSAVVTDMGSTNGTVLTQPGLAAEDLQPGMAVQLLPGAVIDLGDGVTIRVTTL